MTFIRKFLVVHAGGGLSTVNGCNRSPRVTLWGCISPFVLIPSTSSGRTVTNGPIAFTKQEEY